ncbi:MAG: undecaprenyl/decaprenyl-phosphate alpha-N-acetylglucosaminyl 1-phosphate transferase [Endomicrobia bacterium]|nr:undecaprenyl/decaprenyl-phosphate alpha-N-acetylglucosaminyl 1-phosphate transferase [Endomicrobiia bacterium]MCX7941225.1 undecaprenyl/decaprenyl-phosphate alpha-N-acetylglucosaminyl 1-phosphate transferase [Endomicrobiia bacterium]MDW8056081.1 MraY family glycosyltransferase [Elusimicrobiota bacterium]
MFKVYVVCFFLSFFFSIFFVPFSNFLAKKLNIYDRPSKRKIKFRKLTRWGGFGIFLSFFLALVAIVKFFPEVNEILKYKYVLTWGDYQETIVLGKQLLGIFFASLITIIVGTVDDRSGVPALVKFLLQIIIAYCVMDYGVRILGITLPFSNKYIVFPRILTQILTVLWICGFMNMVNLADGVDGLAAGIVFIAGLTFFITSILQKQTGAPHIVGQLAISAILSLLLCGSVAGFLIYNFYPAKLFMGDTGALWLGLIIGCITTVGILKSGAIMSFVLPILVAGIPFVDVVAAITRRIKKGEPIGTPDKRHLHHLLLNSGWTEREVVLFFYVITLFLSIISITIVALRR